MGGYMPMEGSILRTVSVLFHPRQVFVYALRDGVEPCVNRDPGRDSSSPASYLPGDLLGLIEIQNCHAIRVRDVVGVRDCFGLVALIADVPSNDPTTAVLTSPITDMKAGID